MEDLYVYDRGEDCPIEGLDKLRNAIEDQRHYDVSRKLYEDGFVLNMPKKPQPLVAELVKKYPRAAAYIVAELWGRGANWKKAALGKQAMERILAGENHDMVLDEMRDAYRAWGLAQEG